MIRRAIWCESFSSASFLGLMVLSYYLLTFVAIASNWSFLVTKNDYEYIADCGGFGFSSQDYCSLGKAECDSGNVSRGASRVVFRS